ncbi:MFS transporter [Enterococcus faecalis]|uniref:MFS transporter n=1 Tax=Enterococcus faecalis TaxID=1351 RepID=UPI003008E90D
MFPDQEELIFFIGISLFLSLGFRYILKFKKNTTFLLPKEMFTQLNVVSLANGFTYNFSIYGIIFLSIYFQENLHLSSLDTGIKFLPLTITGMLLSLFLSPVLVNKFGQAITQQMCLFAIVAGSALLSFYFLITPIPYLIPVSFFFLGFSGSIAPVLTSVAFVATKEEYQKEISSILNLIRQLGSIVGVTAVSILLNLTGKESAILYYLSFTTLIAFASYVHMIRAQREKFKLSAEVK